MRYGVVRQGEECQVSLETIKHAIGNVLPC